MSQEIIDVLQNEMNLRQIRVADYINGLYEENKKITHLFEQIQNLKQSLAFLESAPVEADPVEQTAPPEPPQEEAIEAPPQDRPAEEHQEG